MALKVDEKKNGYFIDVDKRTRTASYIELTIVLYTSMLPIYGLYRSYVLFEDLPRGIEYIIIPAFLFLEFVYFTLTSKAIIVDIVSGIINKLKNTENAASASDPAYDFDPAYAFKNYISRSRETLKSAQRRPNALMMVGAFTAISGLVFFVSTLPGFIADSNLGSNQANLASELVDLIPRFLMLIFIQLLAGFFLRQYRTSMEEVRYYEAVLRVREDKMIAYCMVKQIGNEEIKKVADSLISGEGKDIMKLQNGESTITIETYRNDDNEFKGPIDKVIELIKGLKQ